MGAGVGFVGSAAACVGALWAAGHVWAAVWSEAEAHARAGHGRAAASIVARSIVAIAPRAEPVSGGVPPPHSASAGLEPLIPGITAPLSHLPILLLTLVACQLFHELGHALAAAIDEIAPSKLTLSLWGPFPAAAVVFPSAVDYLAPRGRARLATAGAWHNLILFTIGLALVNAGAQMWPEKHVDGRTIVGFAHNSALSQQLSVGDTVTHLDDTPVSVGDAWERYLSSEEPNRITTGHGWCASKSDFFAAPAAPCEGGHLTAFVPAIESGSGRCLKPYEYMTVPPQECHCGPGDVCIRPAPNERILRIRYRPPAASAATLLWAGDRAAVLQQVIVGTRGGRGAIAGWISLFMTYFNMVNLSLFLFNLLPLPATDGSQLLAAVLAFRDRPTRAMQRAGAGHPSINPYRYDSEDEEPEPAWGAAGRREEIWARRVRRVVEGTMSATVAAWLAGWTMLALLRSS